MLRIKIPAAKGWDPIKEEFIDLPETTLNLEHSLLSMSKWESIYHKPFLSRQEKTREETIEYIKCMTMDEDVDPYVYYMLTEDNLNAISDYIENPMTATTVREQKGQSRRIITNEVLYFQMFSYGIPKECENWHLNRLITLLKVFNAETAPQKSMSKTEILERNHKLNMQRRAMLNSKG